MSEKIYEPKTKEEKKRFGRGGEKIYEPKTKKEKKDIAKKNLRKSATKPKLDSTPEDKSISRKEFLKKVIPPYYKSTRSKEELKDMFKNYKRPAKSKGLKKGGRVKFNKGGIALRGKGCEIK